MVVKGRCLLKSYEGGYQSGQMGQTVNLLALAFGGSNPSPPTAYNIRSFATDVHHGEYPFFILSRGGSDCKIRSYKRLDYAI